MSVNTGQNPRYEVIEEANVSESHTEGQVAGAISNRSRVPYVHQADLIASADSVQTAGYQGTPVQNNVVASSVSAEVKAGNSACKGVTITNQDGTVALFRWGDTAVTASNFGFAVPAGETKEFIFVSPQAIQMINVATTASGRIAVTEFL